MVVDCDASIIVDIDPLEHVIFSRSLGYNRKYKALTSGM